MTFVPGDRVVSLKDVPLYEVPLGWPIGVARDSVGSRGVVVEPSSEWVDVFFVSLAGKDTHIVGRFAPEELERESIVDTLARLDRIEESAR